MLRSARAIALVVIVAVVVMCALFSLSAESTLDRLPASARPSHAVFAPSDTDTPDDAQGTVDLFGNDVTDAVARYRLDATGSLYEVHSPETEIPKLGSPKS